MNYAFHIDLGDMAYETWYEMYTKPESAQKRVRLVGSRTHWEKRPKQRRCAGSSK